MWHGESKPVVPLPRPRLLNPVSGNTEQPREFPVLRNLEYAAGRTAAVRRHRNNPNHCRVVAAPLVRAVHALQVVEPPPRRPARDEAAWEMVVPKMVRR